MEQMASILQRIVAVNELMAYGIISLGVLTFLGLVISVLGVYRATVHHHEALQVMKEIQTSADLHHREALEIMREIRSASDRLGYYLFRKLGPVELP